ncbi:hypothetical protein Glove_326g164 [Diversispora epigaea]|uniref:Uncharacterized protein n=1 Tax=Diversispora epigaea TaxID=1348612 RepID=A0A397HS51_9GLOM|nr:hypothetical protein Glove_326g164 [Diversispora epigaea]
MNRLEHFYICVPVPLNIIGNQENIKRKVISLNSGISIITYYDLEEQIVKWCNRDFNRIFKLSKSTIICKVTKIKLLVDQTRGKDTNHTVTKIWIFKHDLEEQEKDQVKDNTDDAHMVTLEEYTSKTCGNCGFIKKNLDGSKMFRCDSCDLITRTNSTSTSSTSFTISKSTTNFIYSYWIQFQGCTKQPREIVDLLKNNVSDMMCF